MSKEILKKISKEFLIKNPRKLEKQIQSLLDLPQFQSDEEAQAFYLKKKDQYLSILHHFIAIHDFTPWDYTPLDYTPDSLKTIERLYYNLYEQNIFGADTISIEVFESCLNVYFGEVLVRNSDHLKWKAEGHFLKQDSYYLSVKSKFMTLSIGRLENYYLTPNNKRRQSLYREYKKLYKH